MHKHAHTCTQRHQHIPIPPVPDEPPSLHSSKDKAKHTNTHMPFKHADTLHTYTLNTKIILAGLSYTVTANGRTSIVSTTNVTIVFDIDKFGNSDKFNFKHKLGWILGFRKQTYDITAITTTAECTLDLSGPRYLYLAIDEFSKGNQNSFVSPLSSSLINKNIIARISLDKSQYGYGSILPANTYNGLLATDKRCYTGKIDLQKMQIQLLNETGIPMNLNGYDFSFCLEAVCE